MRTTTHDSATRAQTVASRATLREADDGHLWQEMKELDVMASETHTGVERAQAYGFTNVPAKQDQDQTGQQQPQQQASSSSSGGGAGGAGNQPEIGEQPKGNSAEAIVLYINGSRSHPVAIAVDDRRHRLKDLKEGDVAFYRLKDDRQQFHFTGDGTFWSTRSDRTNRIALVPPPQQQQQQPQQGQQGGQGGQKGGQQQQKATGQQAALDDNKKSSIFFEQQGGATTTRHGSGYSGQRDSDSTIFMSGDRQNKSAQATADHTHIKNGASIWVAGGCFSDMPIIVKKDSLCKA
jgi:hypothetical protein